MARRRSRYAGITLRHKRRCASRDGHQCDCKVVYEAWVYVRRDKRKIRRSFPTLAAARSWRASAKTSVDRGQLRAPTDVRLREAAAAWLEGARSGVIRTRSGEAFKPSTIRGYEQSLNLRLLPDLGGMRVSALTRNDVQDLADRLVADGLDASTVRNALMPLRAVCRRAMQRGEIAVNPTTGVEVPVPRGRRDRVVNPSEARALLAALPERDRAIWATALYAGLRLGELRALRWVDVDRDVGVVHVVRSWDPKEGPVAPKSRAGRRTVPNATPLRRLLIEQRLRTGGEGLVFGRTPERPFQPTSVSGRAPTAWRRAGLVPITMHEARHTAASLMIAAGLNAKTVSQYLGHSSITITFDRYGHLLPGGTQAAREQLDRLLDATAEPAS